MSWSSFPMNHFLLLLSPFPPSGKWLWPLFQGHSSSSNLFVIFSLCWKPHPGLILTLRSSAGWDLWLRSLFLFEAGLIPWTTMSLPPWSSSMPCYVVFSLSTCNPWKQGPFSVRVFIADRLKETDWELKNGRCEKMTKLKKILIVAIPNL